MYIVHVKVNYEKSWVESFVTLKEIIHLYLKFVEVIIETEILINHKFYLDFSHN